ncbi:MAG: hypothetical protein NW205_05755 [Hyphomicrobiaceae bacterium]|nr:hypothetical protein [Hyphomicrobiaceae bacterium]
MAMVLEHSVRSAEVLAAANRLADAIALGSVIAASGPSSDIEARMSSHPRLADSAQTSFPAELVTDRASANGDGVAYADLVALFR